MNIEIEIIQALAGRVQLEHYTLKAIQAQVYRFQNDEHCLFIKWIPDGDWHGANEIRVNQTILNAKSIPTPRLLFTAQAPDAQIACWEWLEDVDLRHQRRDLLPMAFAQLGHFHALQRNTAPVCSPTTRQVYESVAAMLAAELEVLGAALEYEYAEILSLLEIGYPTCIHGDLHPGNIRFTQRGLQFVDWGYAMNSLNLLDLDYVHSIEMPAKGKNEWWHISPLEAEATLPAYFDACGLGRLDYKKTHLAVMLWGALRAHYNALHNDNAAGANASHRNIQFLKSCF